jgi:hypothetical protein
LKEQKIDESPTYLSNYYFDLERSRKYLMSDYMLQLEYFGSLLVWIFEVSKMSWFLNVLILKTFEWFFYRLTVGG